MLFLGGFEAKTLKDSMSTCTEDISTPERNLYKNTVTDYSLNDSAVLMNGDQITFSNNEFGEEVNKGFFTIVVSEQETHRSTSRSGYNLNTLTQIEDTFHHIPKKLSPKMSHRVRSLSERNTASFNKNSNSQMCFEAHLCSVKFNQVGL